MACNCAALLGLVNELMGGSLIAPAGQELRPSAAVTQWADTGGIQEISPQAWASLGVALTHQVPPSHFCTHNCPCSVLTAFSLCSGSCTHSYTRALCAHRSTCRLLALYSVLHLQPHPQLSSLCTPSVQIMSFSILKTSEHVLLWG